MAPPTRVGEAGGSRNLTGAPPPHKRFSLGLHPVSLGKTKEMGWNRSTNLKIFRKHIGEFLKPRPYGGWRNVAGLAETPAAGRRGRRPLQGLSVSRVCAENVTQRRRTGCGRLRPPAKGEPPARVPPLPPPALCEHKGRSARCGARPRAPPLDPARFFVKKRGKKLLNASLHPTQTPRPWGE